MNIFLKGLNICCLHLPISKSVTKCFVLSSIPHTEFVFPARVILEWFSYLYPQPWVVLFSPMFCLILAGRCRVSKQQWGHLAANLAQSSTVVYLEFSVSWKPPLGLKISTSLHTYVNRKKVWWLIAVWRSGTQSHLWKHRYIHKRFLTSFTWVLYYMVDYINVGI